MREIRIFFFASATLFAACGGSSNPGVIVVDDSGATGDGSDVATTDAPPADTGPDPDGNRPGCSGGADAGGGTAPQARGDAMGGLDKTGTKLLVFGGDVGTAPCGGAPKRNIVGDTWLLDVGCGTWKSIDGSAPSARVRGASASDLARNRVLVFGGRSLFGTTYTNYDELWSFDFGSSSWSQLDTHGTGPTGRSNAAMVISATRDQAIVFGGNTSTSGSSFDPQSDVFALSLGTLEWSPIAAGVSVRPPARLFHVMAIDDVRGAVYVYSGGDANAFTGPFLDDLWKLDLASETWAQVSLSGTGPRPRIAASMVWDAKAQRLIVFGGHDDGDVGNQNDVWAIDPSSSPATWQKLSHGDVLKNKPTSACNFPADFTTIDPAAPERRQAFVVGARGDGRGFVVFGGKTDCGNAGDAWWYAAGPDAWAQVFKSPVGLSCLRYSTTCSGLCG